MLILKCILGMLNVNDIFHILSMMPLSHICEVIDMQACKANTGDTHLNHIYYKHSKSLYLQIDYKYVYLIVKCSFTKKEMQFFITYIK